jgi:hypothetical protein
MTDTDREKEGSEMRNIYPTAEEQEYHGPEYSGERTIEIWLPPHFYEDHVDRSLPAGQELEQGKKGVLVFCNEAELREILSDAKHYSEESDYDLGLRSSARATVGRIKKYLETLA